MLTILGYSEHSGVIDSVVAPTTAEIEITIIILIMIAVCVCVCVGMNCFSTLPQHVAFIVGKAPSKAGTLTLNRPADSSALVSDSHSTLYPSLMLS